MLSRRAILLIIGLLSCWCTAFGPPRLTDADLPRKSVTPARLRAMRNDPLPEISAVAVLLANNTTGQIIFARNEHERRAPASLTKIVTAVVALKRGRQEQEIAVIRSDIMTWSSIGLFVGEELNVRQLLFATLIPSDNAASTALGRGLAGSVAGFVRWMNDQVAEWGLQNTRFANPHGLDDRDNYTSAYDMAIITRYAMAEPTFAEIVRLPEWIVNHRVVKSTNELINSYPGMIGVKTGTTDEAGENLVTIVDRPAGQALTVVMGSTDRYRDTRLLLDYYYANYAELHVSLPDTPQSRYLDAEGNWHTLELRAPQTYLVKPWQMENVRLYRRIDQRATVPTPDEPVGMLEVHVAGERLAEVPMYAR